MSFWLNSLWAWQCRHAARAFRQSMKSVERAQQEVLSEILNAGCQSEHGRKHSFQQISGPREFQDRIPIVSYEDLEPSIADIARGTPRVLTNEPISLLQPTGGSSGGEKLIPYTNLLKRQFQRAIQPWLSNLFAALPDVRRGRAYWSISPCTRSSRTVGGVKVGFEQDSDYLSPAARWISTKLLVVPPAVSRLENEEDFRFATLCYLLASEDLALISIWSPTFLLALLDKLDFYFESICKSIATGTMECLRHDNNSEKLHLRRSPDRARFLQTVMNRHHNASSRFRAIWPKLALISCWGDGASALYLPQLQSLFPCVTIQPKGLLATEGFVSVPLVGYSAAALAVRSHFFEFASCASDNEVDTERPRLAHQLERNSRYEVLLTTGGGLYRYRLGDIIEVVDYIDECPLVRFIGRTGGVSDLVGEKLSEAHVRSVLASAFEEKKLVPRFAMLVPIRTSRPGYRLYLECDGLNDALERQLAVRLEQGLSQNPHYGYAARIGQLTPVQIAVLSGPVGTGWQIFQSQRQACGQKIGDIKPMACDGSIDWERHFSSCSPDIPVRASRIRTKIPDRNVRATERGS